MEILLLCLLSCVGIIISFQFTALSYVPNIPMAAATATTTAANQSSSAISNRTHTVITAQGLANPSTIITAQGVTTTKEVTCGPGFGSLCGGWEVTSNGLPAILLIQSVDDQGKVNASLFGHALSNASWDPISKKITFTQTVRSGSNNSVSYEYTGFLHNTCSTTEVLSGNPFHCLILSGSAIPKGLTSEQTAKQEFGWIAMWSFRLR